MTGPYPLLFAPILMPKVWGGARLARFGKPVAPGATIGESWELADLASTSASGAGGGAQCSVIRNGPMAGKTVHDALSLWGGSMLPRERLAPEGRFPLLIKFLDAKEDLSVQVHPSPAYAAAHRDAHLKTECWYILDAERGAKIYKGVRAGVTREGFERALRSGNGSGVVEMLEAAPAVAGEIHNLPSGTVHALGAGVLVAEVQTPSDTTFRVYDWGRTSRELHVAQAMECIEWGPAPRAMTLSSAGAALSTRYFEVRRVDVAGSGLEIEGGTVFMVLGGSGRIGGNAGGVTYDVRTGDTGFVPAAGSSRLEPKDREGVQVLLARVPG